MAKHRFDRPILLAGFVLLAASVGSAQSEKTTPSNGGWTTNGPAGGAVLSLIADPSNPSHLFAGTDDGLFRSEDGGHSWTTSPVGPAGISTLALDPSNPLRLYAGSPAGLSTSTDGGATLDHRSFSFPIAALAIDPQSPSTVYAGGSDNGLVYQSTDGGDSWVARSGSAELVQQIAALVVDPANSTNILAGAGDYSYSYYYQGGSPASIIGSRDAGQTWQVFLPGGGHSQTVQVLAFDPHSSEVVYAAKGNSVYRSSDGGATWHTLPSFHLGSQITSLVLDSLTPGTMYAGTDSGVFRSIDGGSHWALMPGPSELQVHSLALDSLAQVLHVGTDSGVYEAALSAASPSFPCHPAVDTLCLQGGRFGVRAQARDPRTGRIEIGLAVSETDGFGYFSLPAFTGDTTLPEILVKMVDADVAPWNSEWVFFSGLTDVSYVVTVTDTTTGEARSYLNDPSSPFCGGADTSAFPAGGAASVVPARAGALRSSGGADLPLMSGRFRLTLSATDPRTGRTTTGTAIVRDDRFGYFSLPGLTGDPNLPEIFVKMIDGRRVTGTFWLFFGGLTDVGYTLTLEDSVTGEARTYPSPGAFCSAADTAVPGNP